MNVSLKRSVNVALLSGLLALGSVASAAPAFAVVDNIDCNWLGYNCRGFWDHGYTSTTVWSNYKNLDSRHASSVYGLRPDGSAARKDSGCVAAKAWSYASLSNVDHSRQAYYRSC
ncbi:lactococcin 972 family bacteriocin [Cutibacterium avidum]|uniref:lactococcin 972 family bacteriocin n=1 Tax=Cutibacterium avidum TaxID=33010 RepID=UPI0008F5DC11|nr:lactococcin 972 family bacteriocin [Cutibacterium avidum]MDK7698092.1 lactococcin 972 family bacteriocin [Cutibacterium avidum]OIJ79819.1 hypothetical protein APY06_10860 [Cutibacterium avidum]